MLRLTTATLTPTAVRVALINRLLPSDDLVLEPDSAVRADIRRPGKLACFLKSIKCGAADRDNLQNLLLVDHASRTGFIPHAVFGFGVLPTCGHRELLTIRSSSRTTYPVTVLLEFLHSAILRAVPRVALAFLQLVFWVAARFSTGKAAIDFRAAAQRSTHDPMAKSRSTDATLLDRLFAAMGKADANPFERYSLEAELSEIRSACPNLSELPMAGWTQRKLLRQFRTNTAKRRKLRSQLKPLDDAIKMAGWLRTNPGIDEAKLRAAMQDNIESNPAAIEDEEDQDIAFLIDQRTDYRKRQVRKFAVEPFLRLLEQHNIIPSRMLPRNRMIEAWFDYLGLERKLRPTHTGIRTIARNMQKAGRQ